jgi:prevent-host-death family protein
MTRLSASAVREEFSETLNRVAYGGERIVLERRGKDVAALVPVGDLELLERLEDHMDLDAARKALEEPGSVSLDELKAELGI